MKALTHARIALTERMGMASLGTPAPSAWHNVVEGTVVRVRWAKKNNAAKSSGGSWSIFTRIAAGGWRCAERRSALNIRDATLTSTRTGTGWITGKYSEAPGTPAVPGVSLHHHWSSPTWHAHTGDSTAVITSGPPVCFAETVALTKDGRVFGWGTRA